MTTVLTEFKLGDEVPPNSKFLSFCWSTNRAVYEVKEEANSKISKPQKTEREYDDTYYTVVYEFDRIKLPPNIHEDLHTLSRQVGDISFSTSTTQLHVLYRGTKWHHDMFVSKFGMHIENSVKSSIRG